MATQTATDDRRAALAAAFEAAEKEDETPTETEQPEVEAPEEPAEVEAAAAEETPEETPTDGDKARDDKGRFAKADAKPEKGSKPAPAAAPAKPATAQPVKPAAVQPEKPAAPAPGDKPPQSWTAQAREVWKDLPPVAKQEIHRLEGETRRVLQENAGLRKQAGEAGAFRQQIESNLRTWEPIFRAEGTDSLTGAMNVVQTYGALHFAPPQQKAAILLGLIERFSTFDDINAVAEARSQGRMPQAQQYRPPVPQQPQVDPRAMVREELQTMQQQAVLARAEKDYDAFLATNPEFIEYPGIQDEMQTILDAASGRGRNLTYQQAYDLALKMDPSIQSVLQQRQAAAAVTAAAAQPSATAAQRARTAAATIRSRPASQVAPDVDPNDRRAMLEKAWGAGGE